MGLDMYLKAKYKPQGKFRAVENCDVNTTKKTKLTGACGGLFGIAPDDNGCEEIGYWRKAYPQRDLILNSISSFEGAHEDNCVDFLVTEDEVDAILRKAKSNLKVTEATYKVYCKKHPSEDEEDGSVCDYNEFTERELWDQCDAWEDTVNFFTKAKEIYTQYPDAQIYFEQWY